MEWLRLIVLFVLLLVSAYFSAAETALFSLRPLQLQELRGSQTRIARAIVQLLAEPRALLATVLVGNTLVNLTFSVVATAPFLVWFGPEHGPWLATLGTTLVILVFGEIAPKTLSIGAPFAVSRVVVLSLLAVERALRPVTLFAVRLTDWLTDQLGRRIPRRDEALTGEEIKTLVTMGSEHGILGAREKEFIHNVFHLNDRYVADIVTPRVRVFAIDSAQSVATARQLVAEAGFTRVPVYAGSRDNMIGYVEASDLLWGETAPDTRRVDQLMRELRFYPETKRVGELLAEMRRGRFEIAAVVDEHGAFDGVVTLEDALEQVIGEIVDAHDLDRLRFTSRGNGEVLVAAQMELAVFNSHLGVQLRDDEAETIGGYVINRLGHIPVVGERYVDAQLEIAVEKAAPNRIVTLVVKRRVGARPAPALRRAS